MEPQMVVDYRNVVGEGPLWHPAEKKLYWIDIMTGRIMRYDPVSGEHSQFFQGPIVGGFTMQADGSFLLFLEGPAVAELRDGKLHYLIDRLPDGEGYRFNDIIADPAGRVFWFRAPRSRRVCLMGARPLPRRPGTRTATCWSTGPERSPSAPPTARVAGFGPEGSGFRAASAG